MTSTAKAGQQDFTNFPAVPEGHTRVFLNRSFGGQRGRLYGPGWAHVPDTLLTAIESVPDLVRTDMIGAPLIDTTAASNVGFQGTSAGDAAIPHPARSEDDDAEIVDPDAPANAVTAHQSALADAAESAERSGGQTIGETGSHLDTSRTLNPQPGQMTTDPSHVAILQTEAAERDRVAASKARAAGGAASTGTGTSARADVAAKDEPKPATMTALRKVGVEDLRQIAAEKNVKLDDDDDKEAVVAKLYDARVSLDD